MVTKELFQEFSWTESDILRALCTLDKYLLNQLALKLSGTVPRSSCNSDIEDWETTGARSPNDLNHNVDLFTRRNSNFTDYDPEETSHNHFERAGLRQIDSTIESNPKLSESVRIQQFWFQITPNFESNNFRGEQLKSTWFHIKKSDMHSTHPTLPKIFTIGAKYSFQLDKIFTLVDFETIQYIFMK